MATLYANRAPPLARGRNWRPSMALRSSQGSSGRAGPKLRAGRGGNRHQAIAFTCMSHAHNGNLLAALGLAVADRLAEATAHAGGASAAAALTTLYGTRAGARIDGLARVIGLSHSGAVRLVDRLAAEGLVERRRGVDQRSAALHLTPAGRRAARRVLAERHAAMHSLLALLTDDQQGQLVRSTNTLLGRLGSSAEAEGRLCRLCDLEACGRSRGECPVAPPRSRRTVVKR